MQNNNFVIEKRTVHKFKEENVLLHSLRRVLPKFIEKRIFEEKIINHVSQEDYDFINKYYSPSAESGCFKEAGAEYYCINYLKHIYLLESQKYEDLVACKENKWERDLIESLYSKNNAEGPGSYRLNDDISEPYDNFLLNSLCLWDLFIDTDDRAKLSSILEKVPEIAKKDIFYANMNVDTDHSFFFEHSNEHIPALMLVEAVRQMLVACSHVYGKIPFEETQMLLNSMDCCFSNYVNVNYPVLLKGTNIKTKLSRGNYWKYLNMKVEVFQNSKCLAVFNCDASCIGSNLFKRIRRNQISELRKSRFIPKGKIRLEILKNGEKQNVSGRLLDVSLEGVSIKVMKSNFNSDNDNFNITFICEKNKRINGKYLKIWSVKKSNHIIIGLKRTESDETDINNLIDLICCDCMVNTKREGF